MHEIPRPVFVDVSGRRRRLLRRSGIAVGLVTLGLLMLVGYGLATGSGVPLTPWSAPGRSGSDAAKAPHGTKPSLGDKGGAGGPSGPSGPSAGPSGSAPSPGAHPTATHPGNAPATPGGTTPGAPSGTPTTPGTATSPAGVHTGNPHGVPPGLAKKSPRP